jgi:aspartyl-tRNA(Asn)/glutamyl-tRNA(Gln) amidotransferase subunit A
VEDAALVLQTIAGYDGADPYSIERPTDDYTAGLEDGIDGWCLGLGIGDFAGSADPEINAAVEVAVQGLRDLGAEIHRVDVSYLREAAESNGLMTQADAAAYHRERLAERPEWFGDDVRRRLEAGRDATAGDYVLARRVQAETKQLMRMFFADHRILLLPTTPICAPSVVGEDAVAQARQLTRFTSPFNLAGLPAISIPCGMNRAGLPIGLQMIAGAWEEAALLRAARAFERTTSWWRLRPPNL